MEKAVRKLEAADGTPLRERIMPGMKAGLSADGADSIPEVMAANRPADGTDTVLVDGMFTVLPADQAQRVLPDMFTRKSAYRTMAVFPCFMAAGKPAESTDTALPGLMSAEALMYPGDQPKMNSKEAACQQQGNHCQQDQNRFSFRSPLDTHCAVFSFISQRHPEDRLAAIAGEEDLSGISVPAQHQLFSKTRLVDVLRPDLLQEFPPGCRTDAVFR